MHDPVSSLRRLARAYGVQNSYLDLEHQRRVADPAALLAILKVLGAPIARVEEADEALRAWRRDAWSTLLDPVVVVWQGRPARAALRTAGEARGRARCEIALEDGPVRAWEADLDALACARTRVDGTARRKCRLPLPDDLPMGYHRLSVEVGGVRAEAALFVAPRRAWTPEGDERRWGAFLPLYALRTETDWGVGDVYDLGALAQWAARQGASIVGTLPLLAAFLDQPFEPSPYAPVSRLFWNELFLDVEVLPELAQSPEARALLASSDFASDLALLRGNDLVDYRATAAHKRKAVEHLVRAMYRSQGPRREAFEAFLRERPETVHYARFRAAVEKRRESWFVWPEAMRRGEIAPGELDEDALRYHLYAQFAFHEQLAGAVAGARDAGVELYLDLPIGVHPDGFDVWREQETFALGMSAGAPPDPFFTGGQSWGFPPLNPRTARAAGHRYWIAGLRNHLRYARRLRIDHVMGLHRLYWIPEGFGATEGVYVRYPADEMYAAMCIESHRARAEIVGENLGTVPPYIDEALAAHGIRGMYVGEFSITTNPGWAIHPPKSKVLASLNTHDMPTFAGFWHGDDVEERVALGFMDREAASREHWIRGEQRHALTRWLADRGLAPGEERVETALEGSLTWLAGTDAAMVLVNLEDLWLERSPQNVPGTHRELPNWRRRAKLGFEVFREMPNVLRILERVNDARRRQGR